MTDSSLTFLENLCNSFGPSGFERDPIKLTRDYVQPFTTDLKVDKLGSLLFFKNGTASSPQILLPGHVDEVGFIVNGINDKGFITFLQLGGWFDQVLLGQRVLIRTRKGDLEGIIAAKPPHLLPPEERKKVVEKSKMFIDIGCSNKQEVEAMGVRMGDPIMPVSKFSVTEKPVYEEEVQKGNMKLAIGKAFDDRIGAFIAAEIVRILSTESIAHPNTIIGAATTQEEVGIRGARTAAWLAEPDVCITLEVDIAGDVPGIEATEAPAVLGKGPSILTFDASLIPNQGLKELIIQTAEKHQIKYQLSSMARGATDAGAIHIARAGCPSIVIGVPTRHIHSHVGILSLEDVENCIRLLVEVVQLLDQETVDNFTKV
ncbi:M42 family metallopeptidase [candidate division KSB1 bacterium]|nr:M42 family metallopeptidase [candidate division KSB1 bacterium]